VARIAYYEVHEGAVESPNYVRTRLTKKEMMGWVIICYFADAKRFVARYRVSDHFVHHKIIDAVKNQVGEHDLQTVCALTAQRLLQKSVNGKHE